MMFSKFILRPCKICLMLSLFLLAGCIAENLSDCARGISLRVSLRNDIPGGSEAVKDITLYVFDEDDLLLDILPVIPSEPVSLYYPGIPRLRCVSWCNTQGSALTMRPMQKGDAFEQGLVSLQQASGTRAGEVPLYVSPPDLFYGEIQIENNTTGNRPVEQEITVSRMVSSMNITVRGLRLLAGTPEGDFRLVVHETTSQVDFLGRFGGGPAAYSPAGSFSGSGSKDEFIVPDFHLFPVVGGAGLTVDIYHNETLIRSVSTDNMGRPIVPQTGKTLHLLINFEASLDVEIAMTGWGEEYIWKEYN